MSDIESVFCEDLLDFSHIENLSIAWDIMNIYIYISIYIAWDLGYNICIYIYILY